MVPYTIYSYILKTLTKRMTEIKRDLYVCFIYKKNKAFHKVKLEIIRILKNLKFDGKVLRIISTAKKQP